MTSSNFIGKKEKTTFLTRIFNLSPKCFTQISSGNTHWMQNLIPHPRITHLAYFRWILLHEKCQIHEKRDCNHVFHVFLIFCVAGSIKSMQHRYSDEKLKFSSNEYSLSKFE